jgi:hypothetical protein
MCYDINVRVDFEKAKFCGQRHIVKIEVGTYEKEANFIPVGRFINN